MKTFFRVNHVITQQGLWYDYAGGFTGLIHERFDFCENRELKMDFDPEIVGYFSAVETVEQLFVWFPRQDILRLQPHGFCIHEYISDDFKFYERFQHFVINQSNATLVRKILLDEFPEVGL